jgi:hypothetical protein
MSLSKKYYVVLRRIKTLPEGIVLPVYFGEDIV